MKNKIRLGILYGGKSGEHEVSLQTALSVMRALDMERYEVYPIHIDLEGNWYVGSPLLIAPQSVQELRLQDSARQLAMADHANALMPQMATSVQDVQLDVVFPLLHGPNGEDGTIQGLLELANIPYVGAGVLASAVGMDKAMMKTVFAQHGLPQVEYLVFTRYTWERQPEQVLDEIEEKLGYPCFVKPANLGSSVGISKAKDRQDLEAAIHLAAGFDRKLVVEAHVDAREIEVGILGNEQPQASVPGEIVPSNEFYDYEAKYLDGKSVLQIPADLTPELAEEVQQLAIRAFQAIDGSGLARVDFFLRKADGKLLINEINTMPGFTQYSMYPLLWAHSGIPYPELIDRLVELGIERHRDKQRNRIRA